MYVNKHEVHPPYKREKNPKTEVPVSEQLQGVKDVYPEEKRCLS
jgi:hypothetical protein